MFNSGPNFSTYPQGGGPKESPVFGRPYDDELDEELGHKRSGEENDSRRDSHNVAEKRRRDKINEKIDELALLINTNQGKMNKASILQATVDHIGTLEAHYQDLLERNRLLKMENAQLKQAHAKVFSSMQFQTQDGMNPMDGENQHHREGDHAGQEEMFLQYKQNHDPTQQGHDLVQDGQGQFQHLPFQSMPYPFPPHQFQHSQFQQYSFPSQQFQPFGHPFPPNFHMFGQPPQSSDQVEGQEQKPQQTDEDGHQVEDLDHHNPNIKGDLNQNELVSDAGSM